MYSNYQDQDDVLNQLIVLCTDLEYRWKTATCVVCLLLILFWLLGRWRLEVSNHRATQAIKVAKLDTMIVELEADVIGLEQNCC